MQSRTFFDTDLYAPHLFAGRPALLSSRPATQEFIRGQTYARQTHFNPVICLKVVVNNTENSIGFNETEYFQRSAVGKLMKV